MCSNGANIRECVSEDKNLLLLSHIMDVAYQIFLIKEEKKTECGHRGCFFLDIFEKKAGEAGFEAGFIDDFIAARTYYKTNILYDAYEYMLEP